MRIAWAIPCRGVDIPPDGMPNLLGVGMNTFQPPSFPAQLQLALALNIIAREDELDVQQTLEGVVLGPDMTPVSPTLQTPITVTASPSKPEGWEQNSVLPMILVFMAQAEGTHTVQFTIDGRNQPPVPLFVKL